MNLVAALLSVLAVSGALAACSGDSKRSNPTPGVGGTSGNAGENGAATSGRGGTTGGRVGSGGFGAGTGGSGAGTGGGSGNAGTSGTGGDAGSDGRSGEGGAAGDSAGGTGGSSGTSGTGGSSGMSGSAGTPGDCEPAEEFGRDYVGMSPDACKIIKFACPPNTTSFFNDCGCGCEQDPLCPPVVTHCMQGESGPYCLPEAYSHCPYSTVDE